MATEQVGMQGSMTAPSHAGSTPHAGAHSRQDSPRISTVSALRAFADGFGGVLAGGLLYCLVLGYFHSEELALASMRVLLLALVVGGFEAWRVTRMRTLRSVRVNIAGIMIATMLAWAAMGTVLNR